MKYALMFADKVENLEALRRCRKQSVRLLGQSGEVVRRARRLSIVTTYGLQGRALDDGSHQNDKAIVTDGPFIETKEIINGFAVSRYRISMRRCHGQDVAWWGDGRIGRVRPSTNKLS